MKTLKFSLTGIVCLLILAGVIAFKPFNAENAPKPETQKATVFGQWFIYTNGIAYSFSNAINPAYYRPMNPGEFCTGTQTLCAIYAETDPFNPTRPLIDMYQPVYASLVNYYTYGITSPLHIKLKNYF